MYNYESNAIVEQLKFLKGKEKGKRVPSKRVDIVSLRMVDIAPIILEQMDN